MGAFFTNIQLKSLTSDRTIDINEVVELLVKQNIENGYIKVENEDKSDKSIIVQKSDDSSWISIYDQELEDQDLGKLNKVSTSLSKQLNTTTLSVLVHDSHLMFVGLNVKGSLKDSLSNLSSEIDFTKNKPTAWTGLLNAKNTFEDIKVAWATRNHFVEDFLFEFATLIQIGAPQLLTSYEYLTEEGSNEGIKLNFAKKDKNPQKLGLTKLDYMGGGSRVQMKLGAKCTQEFLLTNHGTSSAGLDIIVSGASIENEILVPLNVKIEYLKVKDSRPNEFTSTFIETIASSGEKTYYARFDDFQIPNGLLRPKNNKEFEQYTKTAHQSTIKCSIEFIGNKLGDDNLLIFFSPLVNREEGSSCCNFYNGQVTE